jgi:putative transcriptional regulator
MSGHPNSHPIGDEFLLDYAAGTAPEPVAVLVATHVALNPDSRAVLNRLETAGGALLEGIVPTPVGDNALERVLAQLGPQEAAKPNPAAPAIRTTIPAPLRSYIPGDIRALPWRALAWGLSEAILPCTGETPHKLSLLHIGAGKAFPRHTHRGPELVMVLEGGFTDEQGHYVRGDVCAADEAVEHRPVADPDGDCLCLAVTRGPIRYKGLLGLILNPFLRA